MLFFINIQQQLAQVQANRALQAPAASVPAVAKNW
jgi:hypothetical protein